MILLDTAKLVQGERKNKASFVFFLDAALFLHNYVLCLKKSIFIHKFIHLCCTATKNN